MTKFYLIQIGYDDNGKAFEIEREEVENYDAFHFMSERAMNSFHRILTENPNYKGIKTYKVPADRNLIYQQVKLYINY